MKLSKIKDMYNLKTSKGKKKVVNSKRTSIRLSGTDIGQEKVE